MDIETVGSNLATQPFSWEIQHCKPRLFDLLSLELVWQSNLSLSAQKERLTTTRAVSNHPQILLHPFPLELQTFEIETDLSYISTNPD